MKVEFAGEDLRPLVREVVAEVLEQAEAERAKLNDHRIAYSEAEAARMLGLERHQLRDERTRGNIGASVVVGRRIRYTRDDLLEYLGRRRYEPKE